MVGKWMPAQRDLLLKWVKKEMVKLRRNKESNTRNWRNTFLMAVKRRLYRSSNEILVAWRISRELFSLTTAYLNCWQQWEQNPVSECWSLKCSDSKTSKVYQSSTWSTYSMKSCVLLHDTLTRTLVSIVSSFLLQKINIGLLRYFGFYPTQISASL